MSINNIKHRISAEGQTVRLERILLTLGAGSPIWLFVFGFFYSLAFA